MSEKTKVKLEVDGVSYTFIGEEESAYMRGIAERLNVLVKELRSKNPYLSHVMTMTLVAYTITDRLQKEEIKNKNLEIFVEKYETVKLECRTLEKTVQDLKFQLQEKKSFPGDGRETQKLKDLLRQKDAEISKLRNELVKQTNRNANFK